MKSAEPFFAGKIMHVDDIIAALASRDMATIKEAFMALANYPKEGFKCRNFRLE